MASYRIEWRKSTKKDFRGIPVHDVQKIVSAVEALSDDPFPIFSKKLAGSAHAFRIRIGNYRVIYEVFSGVLVIEIVRVGNRKTSIAINRSPFTCPPSRKGVALLSFSSTSPHE